MRLHPVIWVLGGLAAGGMVYGLLSLRDPDSATTTSQDAELKSDSPAVSPRMDRDLYVGNQACSECHAEIAEHYQRSPMSHSWTDAASFQADEVSLPARVSDPNGPYTYACRLEEGRLIQEERLGDDDDGHRLAQAAAYLVGSGHHAQAMVSESNGYLNQLPVAWFSQEGRWKLNPGYDLKNHRFERPILPGCLACHGGYAEHQSPALNRYEGPVTTGIRCEHCHGPGKEHIAFHEGTGGDQEAVRDPIINPKRLSAARTNDVCLQCHLLGDVVFFQAGADAFSFRPGDKLSDHRLDFLVQTEEPEAFGVASHGSRMMRSRCYTESGGQLTCITCHDPHRPASDFTMTQFDAHCATCHTPESCHRELKQNEVRDATGCVKCHMPRRSTREGQHLVFTDHWIRTASEEGGLDAVPPLLQSNANVSLVGLWPEAEDPRQKGIAYIKLHASMGPQQPALKRGVSLLEQALAKNANDSHLLYWLATGQIAQYRSADAIGHLQRVLKDRPDWHDARYRLAIAYHQMKRYPEAITEYERVIRKAPDWLEPYPLVVRLHLSQGKTKPALRLLKQQLSYRGDATAYLSLALAKHLEGKPLEECLKSIEESLRLNPRNAEAYTTRAYLFINANRKREAKSDYQKALAIDPENAEAQAGLRALEASP